MVDSSLLVGPPLVSYAACTNDVTLNSCSCANPSIYEATFCYYPAG